MLRYSVNFHFTDFTLLLYVNFYVSKGISNFFYSMPNWKRENSDC